jgi:hypothetical protein
MFKTKGRFLAGSSTTRFTIAIVFLAFAGVSALVHADTRSVEGFDIDRVILRGSDELKISFGDANRLLVRGDTEDLDREPFYVRGRTLMLGYTDRGRKVRGVKYLLEVERLEHIEVEGSGEIWVEPVDTDELRVAVEGSGTIRLHSVKADELELSLAGSGNIQLAESYSRELDVDMAGSGDIDLGNISATRMNVNLSGSGDIIGTAESEEGMVEELDISLAGSGDIDLSNLRARRVDIGIAGSGDVMVWAEEVIDVGIIGSGDVVYRGDPGDIDTSTMGSGSVERMN